MGNKKRLMLIAGPCVIESETQVLEEAEILEQITKHLNLDFYFKASFDKANRTSLNSYRGPGLEKGLSILKMVKERYNLKIVTDIHEPYQAEKAAEICDIIQIPAFLCRQTDLIVAAANTGKIINIKKGQFLAPWDIKEVIKKVERNGNKNIMISERGTTFGYNRLVVDMAGIVEMKKFGYPIIFDATHSVQLPGGNGNSTGGNRKYVEYLAKAAIAAGADALFIEAHPQPEQALSDGPNMIPLSELESLLLKILKIYNCVNEL